ncbi:septum site-determining protein MinC [Buchnera aphidicola]|uniref:Probable septum site-determining protein MinC n=1 Tax=Buchnera aphidicola (Cinara cf. splendens/pseudotsugae 3390) TaxID=2518980 RepID=A0A451CXS9_9GAMM|nr:septum site-determining protein MinC [Buchnera aphidicola]VFP77794.1 Septum site-determining protein MinC [Buchnera aphidicola (Cinara cf. splendens/pseudotsugae 3390)]
MKNQSITFKNKNFSILVIYLKNIKPDYFESFLREKIQESPSFFQNKLIVLNVENISHKFNWINIKNFILSIGLFLIGIMDCKDKCLKKKILCSGLPILSDQYSTALKRCNNNINSYYKYEIFQKSRSSTSISCRSYIVNHLIRSGQKIYSPYNDLIITNNVSSGAELISGGNIHIYGNMRGRVLAGMNGDVTRKIFCTCLFAELVSIAGEYLTIEQIPVKFLGQSVEISLINRILYIKYLK